MSTPVNSPITVHSCTVHPRFSSSVTAHCCISSQPHTDLYFNFLVVQQRHKKRHDPGLDDHLYLIVTAVREIWQRPHRVDQYLKCDNCTTSKDETPYMQTKQFTQWTQMLYDRGCTDLVATCFTVALEITGASCCVFITTATETYSLGHRMHILQWIGWLSLPH